MDTGLILTLVLFILKVVPGEILGRCDIAQRLHARGFTDLADWTCLALAGSGGDTSKVTGPDSDGAKYWGLFQISEQSWCSETGPDYKQCNVNCNELVNDDLYASYNCAEIIHTEVGFSGFRSWVESCNGTSPSIDDCIG